MTVRPGKGIRGITVGTAQSGKVGLTDLSGQDGEIMTGQVRTARKGQQEVTTAE
jgi:hypothetical protein